MKGYGFLVIGAICLGTIGIFVKFVGASVHPMVLSFYRVFFAMLTLLIVAPLIDRKTFHPKNRELKWDVFIGFLFAVNMTLTNIAFLKAPVQNVSLILGFAPFFTLLFAYIFLREKITKVKLIALALAIAGMIMINPITAEGMLGNLIAIAVAITDGIIIVSMRKVEIKQTIGSVFWFFLFATLFLLPFPIILGFGTIPLALIALGVMSTGTAYLFYNFGLRHIEAEVSSLTVNIVAVITSVVLALTLLKETLFANVIIGGAVLLAAGIFLKLKSN